MGSCSVHCKAELILDSIKCFNDVSEGSNLVLVLTSPLYNVCYRPLNSRIRRDNEIERRGIVALGRYVQKGVWGDRMMKRRSVLRRRKVTAPVCQS